MTTSPTAAGGPQGDHRIAPRKTTRSLAHVVCNETGARLECYVQDISATGAKVGLLSPPRRAFAPPMHFPKHFRLLIPNDGIEVSGELAWSADPNFGILFRSPFRPIRAPR